MDAWLEELGRDPLGPSPAGSPRRAPPSCSSPRPRRSRPRRATAAPRCAWCSSAAWKSGDLRFYTNRESRKGSELSENPRAALVFHWGPPLRRQVRAEGIVVALSAEESAAYFETRARESRLGAWASPQSRPLADRAELDALLAAAEERFGDDACAAAAVLGRVPARPRSDRALAEPPEPPPRPRPLRALTGRLDVRQARALTCPLRTAARARSSCRSPRRSRGGSPWPPGAAPRGSAASPARAGSSSPGPTGRAARRFRASRA